MSLSIDLLQRVQEEAHRDERSVSFIVEKALRRYFGGEVVRASEERKAVQNAD